jgi:hypothetical protein
VPKMALQTHLGKLEILILGQESRDFRVTWGKSNRRYISPSRCHPFAVYEIRHEYMTMSTSLWTSGTVLRHSWIRIFSCMARAIQNLIRCECLAHTGRDTSRRAPTRFLRKLILLRRASGDLRSTTPTSAESIRSGKTFTPNQVFLCIISSA